MEGTTNTRTKRPTLAQQEAMANIRRIGYPKCNGHVFGALERAGWATHDLRNGTFALTPAGDAALDAAVRA